MPSRAAAGHRTASTCEPSRALGGPRRAVRFDDVNTARDRCAAGIGCRRGCPGTAIRAVLEEALTACGLDLDDLDALASVDTKADEEGLAALADELGIALSLWPADTLGRFEPRLATPSARVQAATGVRGIAEAAALAAVTGGDPGVEGARLALARRGNALATVAIACRTGYGVE